MHKNLLFYTLQFYIILIFLIFTESTNAATTYYVDKDCVHGCSSCSDNNPGTSWATAFCTIQKAANIVNPGDTVIVANGTYTDADGNKIIVLLQRSGSSGNIITFKAENKWGAVLDGQNNTADYCWMLDDNVAYIRIEDFEVKGCAKAGIWADHYVNNIYFYRNHIHDIGRLCTDDAYGIAGYYMRSDAHHITYDSNLIHAVGRYHTGEQGCVNATKNYQNHDHGMYLCGDDVNIINNIFYDNKSGYDIDAAGSYGNLTNWKIINNTFGPDARMRDGDIYHSGQVTNMIIQNNIFYQPRNYAIRNADPYDGGGKTNVVIQNNLVYNAEIITPIAEQYQANFTIQNNIYSDPKFKDLANWDFHLQGGSPAIDKGLSFFPLRTKDADGNSIVGAPDIGAYEYGGIPVQTDTIPPTPPVIIKIE